MPNEIEEGSWKEYWKFIVGLITVCAIVVGLAIGIPYYQKQSAKVAPVAVVKVAKTQAKRKGKMVKIALGHAKQATQTSANTGVTGTFLWFINGPDSRSTSDPGDWTVTEDGFVTVPNNASAIGSYTMEIRNSTGTYTYAFEVVCIESVIISKTPIN